MVLKVEIFVTLKVKNRRFLNFSVTMIVIVRFRNLPFFTFNVKFNLKFPYK